jgi:hypothetical protein
VWAAFSYHPGFVRALLLGPRPGDLLPDDAVLYHCAVNIVPDAPAGSYLLMAGTVIGSDPSGMRIEIGVADGVVRVTDGRGEPLRGAAGSAGGSGGCQINAEASASGGYALLLVVAPLAWRGLRRSKRTQHRT